MNKHAKCVYMYGHRMTCMAVAIPKKKRKADMRKCVDMKEHASQWAAFRKRHLESNVLPQGAHVIKKRKPRK